MRIPRPRVVMALALCLAISTGIAACGSASSTLPGIPNSSSTRAAFYPSAPTVTPAFPTATPTTATQRCYVFCQPQPTPTNTAVAPAPTNTPNGPTPTFTAVPPTPTLTPPPFYGDGSDGSFIVASSRSDTPLNASCSGTVGSKSLFFFNPSGSLASAAGKPVLIYQSQGSGAGTWMKNFVASVSGGTLTLVSLLNATYTTGAQVIVLRQYTDVTVNAGVTWSAKPWDGSKGGILAFLANGTVTINGTISADGVGFRGGIASGTAQPNPGADPIGFQGEGVAGIGTRSTAANGNGGGGGGNQAGLGSKPGGGGGGNGNGGIGGTPESPQPGGAGGSVAGSPDLTSNMVFGGGGGSGGDSTNGNGGGAGGGIILIFGATTTISGLLTANGTAGENAASSIGGAGGGAGGSILIEAQTLTGANHLSVGGGQGGNGGNGGNAGGAGGTGRRFP